jgi:hypothetical protein
MADETTDISNVEQLVICFRWVDDDLQGHEEFVGVHSVPSTDACTLTSTIKNALVQLNLSLSRLRGQCYDGASAMAGKKSGVATEIKKIEPRCLYLHCYGHALNLACSDSIKQCRVIKNALATSFEITKLVKLSPKREAQLNAINEAAETDDPCPRIRIMCPTRWTVTATTLTSILKNYQNLRDLWDWSIRNCKETEMVARLQGVRSQMNKFEFYFGLQLSLIIFSHCDNLNKSLQSETMSATSGQELATMTVKTLSSIRNDASFNLFLTKVKREAEEKKCWFTNTSS